MGGIYVRKQLYKEFEANMLNEQGSILYEQTDCEAWANQVQAESGSHTKMQEKLKKDVNSNLLSFKNSPLQSRWRELRHS